MGVLLSIGVQGSRKKAVAKGKHTWLTGKNPRTLTWGVVILCFLMLMIFICGLVAFSTLDISGLAEDLQDCDRLVINDYFIDFDSGKHAETHISISDLNSINTVADIVISTPLIRILKIKRLYYLYDYMEIEIFQKDRKVDSIIIAYDNLATYGRFGERVYICNSNQHVSLLGQIRGTLFPDRPLRPLAFAEKSEKASNSRNNNN
jgi:hypothetical protein